MLLKYKIECMFEFIKNLIMRRDVKAMPGVVAGSYAWNTNLSVHQMS